MGKVDFDHRYIIKKIEWLRLFTFNLFLTFCVLHFTKIWTLFSIWKMLFYLLGFLHNFRPMSWKIISFDLYW